MMTDGAIGAVMSGGESGVLVGVARDFRAVFRHCSRWRSNADAKTRQVSSVAASKAVLIAERDAMPWGANCWGGGLMVLARHFLVGMISPASSALG